MCAGGGAVRFSFHVPCEQQWWGFLSLICFWGVEVEESSLVGLEMQHKVKPL